MSAPPPANPARVSAREALEAIGRLPDAEIDIAGAALQFGRVHAPEADWAAAAQHLSQVARDCVGLASGVEAGDLLGRATVLAGLLTGEHGYRGDRRNYDDPANANLIRVVERRRGLPVALGILWLHAARAAGWAAHGVNFPGHFLVALAGERGKGGLVLDVFAGGIPLGPDELRILLKHVQGKSAELRPGVLAPMSTRAVLLRLQENLRVRRLRDGEVGEALACTLDMLRVAPEEPGLWRDAARMHEIVGAIAAAIRCHERVAALVDGEAEEARQAIDRLRRLQ